MNGTTAIVAVVALGVAACSDGSTWTGTVTDSAGIQIVANPERGIWPAGSGWTLQEEMKIGAVEGSLEYQFGQIGFIALDSQDRLYVLDAQAQEIRVFSPDGEFLRRIGRPGEGPGELRGAIYVVMGAGDTLFVPDTQNQRLNRFTTDGTALTSVRMSIEDGLPTVFQSTNAGVIAVQIRPLSLPNRPAPDSMDAIVRLESDGSLGDTLMRFPSGRTLNLGGATPEINLYSAEPAWQLRDDGKILFGINDQYRISLYGADGSLERVVTKPFEREPVSQRDKDAILGFMEGLWRDAGVPPAALQQLRSIVHFGEFFPAFSAIQSGLDGTIWVQHVQSAAALSDEELQDFNLIEDSGAPEWDVFDADGRLLGVVAMPPRFAPRLFRDDKIYGVWRDDLDVQHVVRLRIVRPDATAE
jgi:hypothetical protein